MVSILLNAVPELKSESLGFLLPIPTLAGNIILLMGSDEKKTAG